MSIADNEVASLAFCWRLERKDGAGLALTSHDRPLPVNGVRHEPAPGMTPASIRSEMGLEPRSSEIAGALSSAAISEADILAGRWDGASLELIAVDWEAPDNNEAIELLSGTLGQVSAKDGEFTVDLLGAAAELQRPICPLTSPECRAELGDPRCRVDMAGRILRARIVSASGHKISVDQALDERFRFGRVRFLGGFASGETRVILGVAGNEISLRSAPYAAIAVGTSVEIVEGCDKRLETCAARFRNAENFRGEPHLPGNDLLTRYPGA
jgi:uncharacterized phage protein (TIGR02218 family)